MRVWLSVSPNTRSVLMTLYIEFSNHLLCIVSHIDLSIESRLRVQSVSQQTTHIYHNQSDHLPHPHTHTHLGQNYARSVCNVWKHWPAPIRNVYSSIFTESPIYSIYSIDTLCHTSHRCANAPPAKDKYPHYIVRSMNSMLSKNNFGGASISLTL